MRRLLALPILLLAGACSDRITVNPARLALVVGQTATIHATRIPSDYRGIPWAPNRIEFVGSGAVSAAGVLAASGTHADITVQALTPGTGFVASRYTDAHTPGILGDTVATVTVFDCSRGVKLTPEFASIPGTLGEPALLHVTPSVADGTFQWYWGTRGDTKNPITFTDAPSFTEFIPRGNGSFPIWVRQSSPCGIADAAFVVNVGVQRRRASGH